MNDLPNDDERVGPDGMALAGDLVALVSDLYGPVPDEVLGAAKAAWTWRTVDAELAELLEEETLAVRSDTATGFAYAVSGVIIDVAQEGSTVLGQVSVDDGDPAGVAVLVEVVAPEGKRHAVEAEVDSAGGFRAVVPDGRVRVAVTLPDGRRMITPWLPS